MELYRDEVRLLCGKEIGEERKRLLKAIDGDAFPPLKSWPRDKLVLFLLGNGCSPFLIRRWMVLAQYWASTTAIAEKRCRQVDFIINNEDQKKNTWFYHDVHNEGLTYLNGQRKVQFPYLQRTFTSEENRKKGRKKQQKEKAPA